MPVGDVQTRPHRLGGIPDLRQLPGSAERTYRPVETPAVPRDEFVRTPQPAAPPTPDAPAQELDPATLKTMHRIGASVGAGIGALFGYGFLRKAQALTAAGKAPGVFLGKVAPLLGGAFGAYGLYKKITREWNAPGNTRKWDDLIRMAGDGLQVFGAIAAFVPGLGLVAGLGAQLAGVGVSWLGDMVNDHVG